MPAGIFIETEPLGLSGEAGERMVWEAVRQTFTDGERVVFWNYRTFSTEQQIRWEPDILIVSRELGLIVIEVKSCRIDEIVAVEATRWQMAPGFYKPYIYPYHQAEKQLYVLLGQCDKQPGLRKKVPGRVIVALPRITRAQWRRRGFDDEHHTCPPLVFKDDLELGRQNLLNRIQRKTIITERGCPPLDDKQWNLLLKVICGSKPPEPSQHFDGEPNSHSAITEPSPLSMPPRSLVIARLQDWISDIDWQQVHIGMQIPPGPQRIRGIAGSGKTILLCQKAARMHLKHPDWDIALVFFTRTLYDLVIGLVDKWIRHFSGGELQYDPSNSRLRVLHAWGDKHQPGLYSIIRNEHDLSSVVDIPVNPDYSPARRLACACKRPLEVTHGQIRQLFDAILIDEGQDLVVCQEIIEG